MHVIARCPAIQASSSTLPRYYYIFFLNQRAASLTVPTAVMGLLLQRLYYLPAFPFKTTVVPLIYPWMIYAHWSGHWWPDQWQERHPGMKDRNTLRGFLTGKHTILKAHLFSKAQTHLLHGGGPMSFHLSNTTVSEPIRRLSWQHKPFNLSKHGVSWSPKRT